jgi:hypothetical protein
VLVTLLCLLSAFSTNLLVASSDARISSSAPSIVATTAQGIKILGRIDLPAYNSYNYYFDSPTRYLYAVDEFGGQDGANGVYVIDTSFNRVLGKPLLSSQGIGGAYLDTWNNELYTVSCPSVNTFPTCGKYFQVSVIAGDQVIKVLKVVGNGSMPENFAYNPTNQDLYLLGNGSPLWNSSAITTAWVYAVVVNTARNSILKTLFFGPGFPISGKTARYIGSGEYDPFNHDVYVDSCTYDKNKEWGTPLTINQANKVTNLTGVAYGCGTFAFDPANSQMYLFDSFAGLFQRGPNYGAFILNKTNDVVSKLFRNDIVQIAFYNPANREMYLQCGPIIGGICTGFGKTAWVSVNRSDRIVFKSSDNTFGWFFDPANSEIYSSNVEGSGNLTAYNSENQVVGNLSFAGEFGQTYWELDGSTFDPANHFEYLGMDNNYNASSGQYVFMLDVVSQTNKVEAIFNLPCMSGSIFDPNNSDLYCVGGFTSSPPYPTITILSS